MEGYKNIFDDAENKYKITGSKFDDFRYARDIYGFCINGGDIDNQALSYADTVNKNLCNLFLQQQKSLIGYKDHENEYIKIDDLDSKHIFILTYLFDGTDLSFNRIVEIGGGFGNMSRLSNNIVKYDNWDILDLPHMLELQKFYLENEIKDISKINFINAHDKIIYKDNIDLVIGTHSVSEFSWDIFLNYFSSIIKKSRYFYMGYNKYCPDPILISNKVDYILNNGFKIIKNFDYTEMPHGANVSYTLFKNSNL